MFYEIIRNKQDCWGCGTAGEAQGGRLSSPFAAPRAHMGCVNSKVTEAVETTQDTPRSARSRRSSADDADPVMFTAPDENETHEPDPIESEIRC